MTGYDPYSHAEKLGITVIHRPIRTANGLWLPAHNMIVLREGMKSRLDRSTLAHELGHALHGHEHDSPKHEFQADRWAARRMISPKRIEAAARYAPDLESLALDLDVTTPLVVAYLQDRPLIA